MVEEKQSKDKRKPRKKQSARERGYFPRAEAAQSLRQIADTLESTPDGSLVKFSLNVWATPDDEKESVPLAFIDSQ